MLTKLSNSLSNRATILTAAGFVAVGSSVVSSDERFQDNVCILKYPIISMSYNLLPSSINRTVAQCEKNKEEENDDDYLHDIDDEEEEEDMGIGMDDDDEVMFDMAGL